MAVSVKQRRFAFSVLALFPQPLQSGNFSLALPPEITANKITIIVFHCAVPPE
jgi:hypothetical protein